MWHVPRPLAEREQDRHKQNRFFRGFPFPGGPNVGARRNAPCEMPFREWDSAARVWHQGDRILPRFKPKYCFTRPHDGKRPGWLGRVKDALTDEGADVFITASGDERTFMRDRPQRWQWAGWPMTPAERDDLMLFDKDFRMQDLDDVMDTAATRGRAARPLYDYRKRDYKSPGHVMRRAMWNPAAVWSNVQWPREARHDRRLPRSFRDASYEWTSGIPSWAGQYPGGRPQWP